MSPDDWRQVKSILDQAMSRPVAQRDAWLDRQLEGEPVLRAEVVSLLAAYDAGKTLLEPAGGTAPDADLESPHVGDQIGPYRLVREIGRGGMGVVYVAERDDDSFEQVVALKLVQGGLDSAEIERRFLQERQILARLDHPGIARLLDGGRAANGLPYLVMEYVEGEPIDEYCAARSPSLDQRLDLFHGICSAVDYAHRNLVVHRDLKPGNVLVTAEGVPKLLDFGIAKLLQADALGRTVMPTRAGLRAMTPEYASPEQMRGDAITTTSDVYSLGVMLYQLLTERLPYDLRGRALPEVARMICEQPVRPPSTAARRTGSDGDAAMHVRRGVGRRLRGDLDAIVLKALRKEPEERYATVEQLAADLRRLREGQPVLARQGSLGYHAGKFVLRHRFGVAVAAAFVLLLVLFVASLARQITHTSRALDRAEAEAAKASAVQAFLEETLDAANPQSNEGRELSVQEALDRARRRLDSSFAEQPAIKAAVQDLVGKLYSNMGRYEAAEPLLRQALATRRRLDPEATEELARSLEDLGLLLGRSGRTGEAEPLLREALAMWRALYGARHPSVAKNLELLARAANADGEPRRAAELQREAVEIYRTLGAPSVAGVEAWSSLSQFERLAGDLEAATVALHEAGRNLDALAEPSLDLRAFLEMGLGELCEAQARYGEAEGHYRAALDAQRKVFGDQHHWVAQALVRLGTVLTRMGRFEEAEDSLSQGAAILRRQLGPDHPDVAISLNDLAFLSGERGDLDPAEERLLEVLAIHRRNLPDHPVLGVTLRNLGLVEMRQGRFAEAQAHLEEALSLHRRHHGEEHPRTALSRLALAWSVGEQGDWQRPEEMMRRAITALEATYDEDHPRLAEARSLLGLALIRLDRPGEAEGLLAVALPVLRKAHGPGNFRLQRALRTMAELYEARGQAAEGAAYRAQLEPFGAVPSQD